MRIPDWYFNEEWDLTCPEMSAEEAISFRKLGCDPYYASNWEQNGFNSKDAESWINLGFSPGEAQQWNDFEISPEEAFKCKKSGKSFMDYVNGN